MSQAIRMMRQCGCSWVSVRRCDALEKMLGLMLWAGLDFCVRPKAQYSDVVSEGSIHFPDSFREKALFNAMARVESP